MTLLVVEPRILVTAFAAPLSLEAKLLTVLAYNGLAQTIDEIDKEADLVASIPGARIGGIPRGPIREEAEEIWLRLHDRLHDVPALSLVTSRTILLDVIDEVGRLRHEVEVLHASAIHDTVRLHTARYVTDGQIERVRQEMTATQRRTVPSLVLIALAADAGYVVMHRTEHPARARLTQRVRSKLFAAFASNGHTPAPEDAPQEEASPARPVNTKMLPVDEFVAQYAASVSNVDGRLLREMVPRRRQYHLE